MVLLCITLDLGSLSPSVVTDLKQSLLQLANLYAISHEREYGKPEVLRDRIGLCYIQRNRSSCSDELKIAYLPEGNFSLRDFHHAVKNLPTDAFFPEMSESGAICGDAIFSSLLSSEVLYSWGGKDILRKVIFLSSRLAGKMDSIVQKNLIDAANKCVSVEFVYLEREYSCLNNDSENIKEFVKSVSDLENCSIRTCLPDIWVLCGLVKQWLQELKDDLVEPLQAVIVFKCNIMGSVNQIFCNLLDSVNHITDEFRPCQTCRCHGVPLDVVENTRKGPLSCPVTCHGLRTCDVSENAVMVGGQTILFLPSFESCPKLQQVSSPVVFSVIERTNLVSLSEGLMIGTSYIVTPSDSHEIDNTSDESDKLELNTQFFRGLCGMLHSLDQGLLCSSNYNIETMRESTFQCFYILQPSDKGLMLLRRIAGLEEILPIANAIHSSDSSVPMEIKDSIEAFLLKMELRDYNPLLHERGFHAKLNLLVKESLQFGSLQAKWNDEISGTKSPKQEPSELGTICTSTKEALELEDETPSPRRTQAAEDKTASCISEWEQLMIVNEVPTVYSPTHIAKSKKGMSTLSPTTDHNKPLDEKTSRILERLETPRQLKTRMASPVVIKTFQNDACITKKKPLLFRSNERSTEESSVSTQPMKPSFQRLKRKQR